MNPVTQVALQDVLDWYATLSRDSLPRCREFYTLDARFKDPFNDVAGIAAIENIFTHMFDHTERPRFVIREVLNNDDRAFISWDFEFWIKGTRYVVQGASRLLFDDHGKVMDHRDYWDPAEELWSKMPIIGGVVTWLRERFAA
ncbi:nuclear transport factor 2 family protein [Silvimonas iriomotensis]|uniref:SnoaL-like domain-containing protein n=1 Tax=Silvimonas iriomotensis TaxID=449662 RepID=A0ABQ2P914_9NEIS|nr:nuclear transport factor 2 family protein [Silvimonas iriomotensis]GGP21172.1 hypothetical protein GCM10010970_19170 [Silvimonas iriomotensis]